MRTQIINTPTGTFEVSVPNTMMAGDGFYVSHNDHDIDIYGGETTALVFGQMERFYILMGDHRSQYAGRIGLGFDSCLDYFKEHIAEAHENSNKL